MDLQQLSQSPDSAREDQADSTTRILDLRLFCQASPTPVASTLCIGLNGSSTEVVTAQSLMFRLCVFVPPGWCLLYLHMREEVSAVSTLKPGSTEAALGTLGATGGSSSTGFPRSPTFPRLCVKMAAYLPACRGVKER
ncbi:hypothetical protein Q8A73_021854 [Channa argus]|nr:hypothetical protein Q8A73_021854 [Channa argus]